MLRCRKAAETLWYDWYDIDGCRFWFWMCRKPQKPTTADSRRDGERCWPGGRIWLKGGGKFELCVSVRSTVFSTCSYVDKKVTLPAKYVRIPQAGRRPKTHAGYYYSTSRLIDGYGHHHHHHNEGTIIKQSEYMLRWINYNRKHHVNLNKYSHITKNTNISPTTNQIIEWTYTSFLSDCRNNIVYQRLFRFTGMPAILSSHWSSLSFKYERSEL